MSPSAGSENKHLSSPVSAFVGEDAQLCVVTLAGNKLWHKRFVDFNGGNELYNPDLLLIKSFATMLRPASCSLPTRRRSSVNTSHQVDRTVTTNMTLKHNMNLNESRLHYCAFHSLVHVILMHLTGSVTYGPAHTSGLYVK